MGLAGAGGASAIAALRRVASVLVGLVFFGGPVAMLSAAVSARTSGYVDARDVVAARVRRFVGPARLAADAEGVPLPLVLAVASAESSGRPDARSSAGAVGLMQLMPATAEELAGGRPPALTDPATSLRLGARYLRRQRDAFASYAASEELALCAYNAGPGAVRRWLAGEPLPPDETSLGAWIPYAETRAYVRRVVDWQQFWRAELRASRESR